MSEDPKGKSRSEANTENSFGFAMSPSASSGSAAMSDGPPEMPDYEHAPQNEDDITPSIENLKSRGSGQYTCTEGMTCTRGGVVDGQLRVFKRNCDFR